MAVAFRLMPLLEKFRKQMEAIRELGLNVITMDDFMEWKRGKKDRVGLVQLVPIERDGRGLVPDVPD